MFPQESSPMAINTTPQGLMTTIYDGQPSSPTWHQQEESDDRPLEPLIAAYRAILEHKRLEGEDDFPLLELIGQGGQGVVFRTECRGSDGFAFPAAVKVYSPEKFPSVRSYENAMRRSARVASSVAATYHWNVVGIQGFRQHQGIRLMFMDLVDGYDLRCLLSPQVHEHVRRNASGTEWSHLEKVVMTDGPERARLLPGVAVAIIRDCLVGLASLHRLGIVHGDIKPANIMLQRSIGHAEIVDLGSAFEVCEPPTAIIQTPAYAAPEAMANGIRTAQRLGESGLCAFGAAGGQTDFPPRHDRSRFDERQAGLAATVASLLPGRLADGWKLIHLLGKLIAPDPEDRFLSADDADLNLECGASAFLNELAQVGLSVVYDSDIRHWLHIVACGT